MCELYRESRQNQLSISVEWIKHAKKDVDHACLVACGNDLRVGQMLQKYGKKKQEMFEKMKSEGQNSRRNTGGTGAFSGSSYSPLQMLAG